MYTSSQVWWLAFVHTRRGQTVEEIKARTNFRFHSDSLGRINEPWKFRNFVHRAERRKIRAQIHHASQLNLLDELVDYRAKLPYWD
jgi:hypothetical protein